MDNPLRTFRSFAAELIKSATKANDADIRHLISERNGEEYLQGGRLLANSAQEAQYVRKEAKAVYSLASGNYDLKAHTKKNNAYQKTRDYAVTGMKGALTGLGVLTAANAIKGRFGTPKGRLAIVKAKRRAQIAASAGAMASLADRAYRHDEFNKQAFINQTPGSTLGAAGTALSNAGKTGAFKSSIVHHSGKPPRVIQLGQKFRIP